MKKIVFFASTFFIKSRQLYLANVPTRENIADADFVDSFVKFTYHVEQLLLASSSVTAVPFGLVNSSFK